MRVPACPLPAPSKLAHHDTTARRVWRLPYKKRKHACMHTKHSSLQCMSKAPFWLSVVTLVLLACSHDSTLELMRQKRWWSGKNGAKTPALNTKHFILCFVIPFYCPALRSITHRIPPIRSAPHTLAHSRLLPARDPAPQPFAALVCQALVDVNFFTLYLGNMLSRVTNKCRD